MTATQPKQLYRTAGTGRTRPSRRPRTLVSCAITLTLVWTCCADQQAYAEVSDASISGVVVDHCGPVPQALVKVQTTDVATTTDAAGHFVLTGLRPNQEVSISAWAPGYYIAGGEVVVPPAQEIVLDLEPHAAEDNPHYQWRSSLRADGDRKACVECHSSTGSQIDYELPADGWRLDAHSRSAVNPRFLSMYNGTDLSGRQSPPTRFGKNRDYGRFPLPPDKRTPYYGPGYKLDFPNSAGNCAACHVPLAAIDAPYSTDPSGAVGAAAEGCACDFCHKVVDVSLRASTGLPPENMPGVLSYKVLRPPDGARFFTGSLDDVAPGDDVYSPVHQASRFCAPCHRGVFWNTVVYNSFGEWLDSEYSNPTTGKTCQDCHMMPHGGTHVVLPDKGGRLRRPDTIHSHRMPGASDEKLLADALTLTFDVHADGDQVIVNADVTNTGAGHDVPTGSPLRHVILRIQATDGDDRDLELVEGPTIPEWCGGGDPSDGACAGSPGKVFAKVLEEQWTGVSPTGAYWNPTRVVSDNRIAAMQSNRSTYKFRRSAAGPATIRASLVFRRAYMELQQQKGWNLPDILMQQVTATVGG